MRITVERKLTEEEMCFTKKSSFRDFEPESNDGYRRGFSYTTTIVEEFQMFGEQVSEGGYSYSLVVKRDGKECNPEFSDLYFELLSRGIQVVADICVGVKVCPKAGVWTPDFHTEDGEGALEINFARSVRQLEDAAFTVDEFFAHLSESKELKIARAIGDSSPYDKEFVVRLDKTEVGLVGTTRYVAVKLSTIGELLENGVVSREEVKGFLMDYTRKPDDSRSHTSLKDDVVDFLDELPEEAKGQLLAECEQTSKSLNLFRQYCPQHIQWGVLTSDEFIEADLGLMAASRVAACTAELREFLASCMKKPTLEKTIVANAASLVSCDDYAWLQKQQVVTSPEELFRALCNGIVNQSSASISQIVGLAKLNFGSSTRADYDVVLEIANKVCLRASDDVNVLAAFLLSVGMTAKVPEDELQKMLEGIDLRGYRVNFLSSSMKLVYTATGFRPGLELVRNDEQRKAAEKEELLKKRDANVKQIIQFMGGKTLVCANVESSYKLGSKGYDVVDTTGELVGTFLADDTRLMRVVGKKNSYVIDVEKVRRLRQSSLHLDVLEVDAGYIIGPKGIKLKELTERLKQLGCTQIANIRVHTHAHA